MNIRLETPSDFSEVELLTREAFWGAFGPTCDEHYLAHTLRNAPSFIPELDLVCEENGKLVGNVMYTKAKVVKEGAEREVITFGPLSVLPEYQRSGVGAALMKHSILKARDMGFGGVVFYGHPDYYPRFGFQNAGLFGITAPDGSAPDALMAMELYDGALDGVSGVFREDSLFDCDAAEVTRFNALLPEKTPAVMTPISVLLDRLSEEASRTFEKRDIPFLAWLNRVSGRELLCWEGVDLSALGTANRVLAEYGFPRKLFPGCEILEKAKLGIKALEV